MTVSVEAARVALGLSNVRGGQLFEVGKGRVEYDPTLQMMIDSATAVVERYAPNAPVAVKDEAVIRMLGYQADAPRSTERTLNSAGKRKEVVRTEVQTVKMSNVFWHSGASSLLSMWREHGAGILNDNDEAEMPDVAEMMRKA